MESIFNKFYIYSPSTFLLIRALALWNMRTSLIMQRTSQTGNDLIHTWGEVSRYPTVYRRAHELVRADDNGEYDEKGGRSSVV